MDAQRIEVCPLLARTATHAVRIENFGGARYGRLVIDVTAVADTPSVVVTIKAVEKVSGKESTVLASAAITGTGTTVLKVGPGLTAGANAVANDVMPPLIEIEAVHADTDSITYSMGLELMP